MASSLRYKLWLRNGSVWTEVPTFQDMTWTDGYSSIPRMNVSIVTRDSTIQNLLTANRIYRVTKTNSTNGEDGTRIQTGYLGDPEGDEKTSVSNNKPVVWRVEGMGFGGKLSTFAYDPAKQTQTIGEGSIQVVPVQTGTMSSLFTNIVADVNGRASGTLVNGTYDHDGVSHSVKFRQDKLYDTVMDIASLGDSTTQFPYRVLVSHSASFVPTLNVLKPNNTTFVHPNGVTGSRIALPVDGTDEDRIIDETSEIRSISVSNEESRIRNAVDVKYGGVGSSGGGSNGQRNTGYSTVASSITAFGRKETDIYAPWIQSSTTAQRLRTTILNMYNGLQLATNGLLYSGAAVGIQTAEIVLRDPEVYVSTFNANIGDTVKVRRTAGTVIYGKLMYMEYSQSSEALLVVLGLPKGGGKLNSGTTDRGLRQNYNALEATTSAGTAVVSSATEDSTGFLGLSYNTSTAAGATSTATGSSSISGPSGFYTTFSVNVSNPMTGPVTISVLGSGSDGSITYSDIMMASTILSDNATPNSGSNSTADCMGYIPYGFDLTTVKLRVVNMGSTTCTLNGTIRINGIRSVIDTTHGHNI